MTLSELLKFIPYCEDIDICTYDYQQIIYGTKRAIIEKLTPYTNEEIYGIEAGNGCILITLAKDYEELFDE